MTDVIELISFRKRIIQIQSDLILPTKCLLLSKRTRHSAEVNLPESMEERKK